LANIKSQIKRNRQNDKQRLRNRVYRGEARTAVKNARAAIEAGNAVTSKVELLRAISALDKAAEKGVLHKNNAARRKGRLMKAYAAMKPVEVKMEEPAAEVAAVAEPKKRGQSRAAAAKPAAAAAAKGTSSPKGKKPVAEKAVKEVPAKAAKGKKPAAEKPAAKEKKPVAEKPAKKAKKPAAKK
jgi:small subunit ribosomal protein S20